MKIIPLIAILAWSVSVSAAVAEAGKPERVYAILVSRATFAKPKWRKVVEALREKHHGCVVQYRSDVREAGLELSARRPDFLCLVIRPEEFSRPLILKLHDMVRKLDDDRYEDALWGIITGYDSTDALRIAKRTKPLVLRRAVSGTLSIPLGPFESGLRCNEIKKGQMWLKTPDGKTKQQTSEPDCTSALVEALNNIRPECFFTSGHATSNDWQIGYTFKGGQFRCKDGQLYAKDSQGKKYQIKTPNPKVYLAVGNCLIGMIPKRDCMALAWMHSGGAYQMFAHVAVQFYGHMGWGMRDLLVNQPGRFNVTEAFYFNSQSLLWRLKTEYPTVAAVSFEDYNVRRNPKLMPELALRHGLLKKNENGKGEVDRDALGLLWERDTVVLYGDPAWDARLKRRTLPWDQKFTIDNGVHTFTVTAGMDGSWPRRPLTALLPNRLESSSIEIIEGADLKPVITDNFILLPLKGKFKKAEQFKVVFRAEPLARTDGKLMSADLKNVARAVALMPKSFRTAGRIALWEAGKNRGQLMKVIKTVPKDQRRAAAFLIANMPPGDLKTLSSDFLAENIDYAFKARRKAPWGKKIPDKLFYRYVLPYANFNERRDNWRKDFYDRFSTMAWKCKTASAAAQLLNREIFKALGVTYHATKRPKPDQSPYESIEASFASCSGLSILQADACRAVGIPARVVGIPQWKDKKGDKQGRHARNHSWVEIWDGQWYYIGAAEPKGLNKTWFSKKVLTTADHRAWPHRIYAASFRKTGMSFPLVWNLSIQWVPATDVTRFYTIRRNVTLKLPGGKSHVTACLNGEPIVTAEGTGKVEFPLAGGMTYDLEIRTEDGKVYRKKLKVPAPKPPPATQKTKKKPQSQPTPAGKKQTEKKDRK